MHRNIHILGCFNEKRVTVLAQQIRALSLVSELFRRGPADQEVAVVGAGVAGLTAAAGAAILKCKVTLFERKEQPLHLLVGNHTRTLHPHIYKWPNMPEGDPADAGLPILNWRQGIAGNVAEQLLASWREIRSTLDDRYKIKDYYNVKNLTIHKPSAKNPKLTISWHSLKSKTDSFDHVILAVGYGVERTFPPLPSRSYWRDDDLHQTDPDPRRRTRRYLVSGCGDGGLVDALRLRIRSFNTWYLDFVMSPAVMRLKDSILELEGRAKTSRDITNGYDQLRVPQRVLKEFRKQLRTDTHVTLNGSDPYPLTIESLPVNRFLVSLLLKEGLEYRAGALVPPAHPISTGIDIEFDSGSRDSFDDVIIRHGAERALFTDFKKIWNDLTNDPEESGKRAIEPTRLFDAEDFEIPREPDGQVRDRVRRHLEIEAAAMGCLWREELDRDNYTHGYLWLRYRRRETRRAFPIYIAVRPSGLSPSRELSISLETDILRRWSEMRLAVLVLVPEYRRGRLRYLRFAVVDSVRTGPTIRFDLGSRLVPYNKSRLAKLLTLSRFGHMARSLGERSTQQEQPILWKLPNAPVPILDYRLTGQGLLTGRLRTNARDLYCQWQQTSGLPSRGSRAEPCETVSFTLKGWRHLMSAHRAQAEIVNRLQLLGVVPHVLLAAEPVLLRRVKDRLTYYRQTCLVRMPRGREALVRVVTVSSEGGRRFHSVYEERPNRREVREVR